MGKLNEREIAVVDTPEWRRAITDECLRGGSMQRSSVTLGQHIGAVIVFGESQVGADRRALRLATGWNAVLDQPWLETREVLAAAYLGPGKQGFSTGRTGSMLSHAVEVGPSGSIVRVLCGRVSPLSIADAGAQDITLDPTCKTCLARKKKWRGSSDKEEAAKNLARRLEERLEGDHFSGVTNRGLVREAIAWLRHLGAVPCV